LPARALHDERVLLDQSHIEVEIVK
jgi:hypothetical protein